MGLYEIRGPRDKSSGSLAQPVGDQKGLLSRAIGKRWAPREDLFLQNAGFGTTARAKVRLGNNRAKWIFRGPARVTTQTRKQSITSAHQGAACSVAGLRHSDGNPRRCSADHVHNMIETRDLVMLEHARILI